MSSDFIPVSISTLQPADSPKMNLYQKPTDQEGFVLYCAEDHPLLQEDLDRLQGRGISRLYIESGARESFQEYLRDVLNPSGVEEATIKAKTGALNYVVKDVLETKSAVVTPIRPLLRPSA
ncbi:MAG: hypothetical protein P8L85_03915 [Rubripirellula sp.]|nr:hypothetical protein [Rubripirellula sp.]